MAGTIWAAVGKPHPRGSPRAPRLQTQRAVKSGKAGWEPSISYNKSSFSCIGPLATSLLQARTSTVLPKPQAPAFLLLQGDEMAEDMGPGRSWTQDHDGGSGGDREAKELFGDFGLGSPRPDFNGNYQPGAPRSHGSGRGTPRASGVGGTSIKQVARPSVSCSSRAIWGFRLMFMTFSETNKPRGTSTFKGHDLMQSRYSSKLRFNQNIT